MAAPKRFTPGWMGVRAIRIKRGLTQQQAADLLGVHVVTWRRWESTKANKRRMSPQMWELWQIKTEGMR